MTSEIARWVLPLILVFGAPLSAQVTINVTELPEAQVGVLYDYTVPLSNTTPTTWCRVEDPLQTPPGLQVGCRIFGTPSMHGVYGFMFHVQGPNGVEASRFFTLRVREGIYFQYSDTSGAVGTALPLATPWFTVSGTAPYQFSVESGSLAPGLTLNPATGAVSGVPITGGYFEAQIRGVDALGRWGRARIQMNIMGAALELSPHPVTASQLPPGKAGFPYSVQFSVSGGTAPYRFVARDFGNGLSMNGAGLISGTPRSPTLMQIQVQGLDANNNTTGDRIYTINVGPGGSLNWSMMPERKLNEPFSWSFTVSGMGSALQPSVTGALPPGLAVSMGPGANEGRIAGTPTTAGIYDFVLRLTDSTGAYVESAQRLTFVGTSATPLSIDTDRMPDAMAGDPYSYQIPVSGGTPPYTFQIVNLPHGLTVHAQTGVVSGTTVQPFEYSISVTVQDAVLGSAQKSLPFKGESRSLEHLTITAGYVPEMVVEGAYWISINVFGATGISTYEIVNGELPPGLEVVVHTYSQYELRGTPTRAGTYEFEFKVTDSRGWFGRKQFRIVVKPLTLTILPEVLPGELVEGTQREWQLSAAGATPPLDWSLGPGNSGSGFHMGTNGVLYGSALQTGERDVRVNVKDATGQYGSRLYRVKVVPGGLTLTGSPAFARIHTAYQTQYTASGGTPPYTWSLYGGELPEGLALHTDGRVAGTPRRAGAFGFALRAVDAQGRSGTLSTGVEVEGRALYIQPVTLPDARSGEAYSVQFTASGGQGPYRFQLTESHNWFYGFTLSEAGRLLGSAVSVEDSKVRMLVTVFDAEGSYGNAWREFWFRGKTGLQMGPAELPVGNIGASYRVLITAAGGTPPYAFRVTSGSLPPGLNLLPDGQILGSPQQEGAFPLTIEVTDAAGAKVSRNYTLAVGNEALRIEPSMLPAMTRGVALSVDLRGEGGTAPYRFRLSAGALPAGLALTAEGRLSGTPSAPGAYSFMVGMTDATERNVSRQYTGTVRESSGGGAALTLTTDSLPVLSVGQAISVQLQAAGGTPPYSFERSSGTLPPGTTISGSGVFSGTPSGAGTFVFQVQVSDAAFARATRSFTVAVQGAGMRITPALLPKARWNSDYRVQLKGEGGVAPYRFSLIAGELPPSFRLRSDGLLEGYPRHSRPYTFTIQATDWNGQSAEQQYLLEVEGGGLVMAPGHVSPFPVGRPYELDITTSGGQPPFAYNLKSGTLPRGLTLNAQGQVRGTPAEAGVFPVLVEVKDFYGETAQKEFRLQVNGLTVLPESLPEFGAGGTVDVQFRTDPVLEATTFAAAGPLPAGLTLTPQGRLSGTFSGAADGALVIHALWNGGVAGSREYRLLATQPLSIRTTALPDAIVGRYYQARVDAVGGRAPYQFRMLSGPAGLGAHPHGVLDGMLAREGAFDVTIEVVDAAGSRASRTLPLAAVAPSFLIETTWLEEARKGVPYETRLRAAANAAQCRWTVIEGTLPAGMQLSTEGVLSGLPEQAGTFVFTVKAEGDGAAFQTLTLAVEDMDPDRRVTLYPVEVRLHGVAGEAAARTACAGLLGAGDGVNVQAVPPPAAGWLSAVVEPGRVCLTASAAGLGAGVWPAVLELRISGAEPDALTVPVEFRVAPPEEGLRAWPAEVSLSGEPVELKLTNHREQAVVVDLVPSADWLTVSPAVLDLAPGASATVLLEARSAGLTPGLYQGAIEAQAAGAVLLSAPVRFQAGLAGRRLGASVSQFQFVAWEDGAEPAPATIIVRNDGGEEAVPEVAVEGDWLQAGDCPALPAGGICSLTLSARAEGLAPGQYRGHVTVSGGALPVQIAILLSVLGRETVATAEPVRLLLSIPESGAVVAQTVEIPGSPARQGPVEVLLPPAPWLAVTPEAPEVSAGGLLRFEVRAAGLRGGREEALLLLRFANGETQILTVTAIVSGESCELLMIQPGNGFRGVVGEPLRVRALIPLCGGAGPPAATVAGTLDGTPFLLQSAGEGRYEGEVTPRRATDNAELVLGAPGATSAVVWGRVRAEEPQGPFVQVVKTGAGLPGPVAADARIRLEGRNLAPEDAWTEQLKEELGGVRVTLGGVPLLLTLVSPARIDGYVPATLPVGGIAALVVTGPEGPSPPVPVAVVPAHPQVYTADETGAGPALASHAESGVAVTEAAPVQPGAEVRMYVSGLPAGDGLLLTLDGMAAEMTGVTRLEEYPGLTEVRFRVPALTGDARLARLQLIYGTLPANPVGLFVKP